jgi:tetratricopeptide (TPR) repeat protein
LQDANESESFIAFISKYLDEKSGVMDEYVLRQIHIAFNPLKQIVLAQEESLNWITYALLQKEADASKCDIYRNLAEKQFTPELTLENICCLLEAKEAFNYDHAKEDKQILEKYEEELKTALAVYSNPLIKKHLHHHLGKTQRRMKNFEQAIEQFGQVLKIEPDCFPAYGQIMKCARKKDKYKSEYIDAAKKILEAIKNRNEKLPLRTALALISDLRSGDLREVYSDQKELCGLFKSLILKAAYDGMNQFYEAFVAFGDYMFLWRYMVPFLWFRTLSSFLFLWRLSYYFYFYGSVCELLEAIWRL